MPVNKLFARIRLEPVDQRLHIGAGSGFRRENQVILLLIEINKIETVSCRSRFETQANIRPPLSDGSRHVRMRQALVGIAIDTFGR